LKPFAGEIALAQDFVTLCAVFTIVGVAAASGALR